MRARIFNFQSLAQVDIKIEGLTVIVGPSDIGKSALIRAISAALYGMPGEYFIRAGTTETVVALDGVPKVNGGTLDVEWHKGKGINYFVIDGEKYDKVARETPAHLPIAGYKELQINDEYIRPQISEQHDRMFLLDRSGAFVHDVIAQASRLSVLLRADKACATDLKRQKTYSKVRLDDLEAAEKKLEGMQPIRELHSRVQLLKPKLQQMKTLAQRIENLKALANDRKVLKELKKLEVPAVDRSEYETFLKTVPVLEEVRQLAANRRIFTQLPAEIPSAKPYDFDGIEQLMGTLVEAKVHASERKKVYKEYVDARSAHKSIVQDGESIQAELDELLASIEICPVCERPMPHEDSSHQRSASVEEESSLQNG